MKIIVENNDSTTKTIDEFFAKFSEFSVNHELVEQTTRFLKVLTRHSEPETINIITDKVANGRSFSVSGKSRTYTIVFEIKNNTIILKELW